MVMMDNPLTRAALKASLSTNLVIDNTDMDMKRRSLLTMGTASSKKPWKRRTPSLGKQGGKSHKAGDSDVASRRSSAALQSDRHGPRGGDQLELQLEVDVESPAPVRVTPSRDAPDSEALASNHSAVVDALPVAAVPSPAVSDRRSRVAQTMSRLGGRPPVPGVSTDSDKAGSAAGPTTPAAAASATPGLVEWDSDAGRASTSLAALLTGKCLARCLCACCYCCSESGCSACNFQSCCYCSSVGCIS